MPYVIKPKSGKFQVVEKDTGKVVGTHPTKQKAVAQMRALYANVSDANKSGARNSASDIERLKQIQALVVELLGEEEKEPDEAKAWQAVKYMATADMDPEMAEAYCRQEMYDIQTAASALSMMANLTGDADEPEDVTKIADVMRGICNFIMGEIDEMEAAGQLGDNDAELGEGASPTEVMVKQAPAFHKQIETPESMNLSYVKGLHSILDDKDFAVKYVGRNQIRHPVFLWGDPNQTDLEGEFFTKSTNFWDEILGKSMRPLTWDHAQDPTFKADPLIGKTVEWEDDDVARWAISILDTGHKYRKAIDQLIDTKSLGSAGIAVPIVGASSDSAPQYVKRVKVGKSIWLERWPWFATALTPVPCEPRMIEPGKSAEFIKSLGIQIPEMTQGVSWEWNAAKLKLVNVKSKLSI